MKLVKSLLLGSAAAFAAAAGAQAADLPSKKAAPVAYVQICDAYGAGFWYIPGTDICLKVGGIAQARYVYTQTGNTYLTGQTNYAVKPNTVLTQAAVNAGTVSNLARPIWTQGSRSHTAPICGRISASMRVTRRLMALCAHTS